MENWKDICGYEGLYQVSDLGRVRRIKTDVIDGVVQITKDRLLKQHSGHQMGYLQVVLSKFGETKTYRVHVLVCLTFIGKRTTEDPRNQPVLHINGNPTDNRLCNLRYGTPKENVNQSYVDSKIGATRNERLITYNGETKNCTDWAKQLGVTSATISDRLSNGWSLEKTLTTPKITSKHVLKSLTYDGITKTYNEWAKELGISVRTLKSRIDGGKPLSEVLTLNSKNTNITHNNVTKTRQEWALEIGITERAIRKRLNKGWSVEKTLTTPSSRGVY